MGPDSLTTATFEELIDELGTRCIAVIVCAERQAKAPNITITQTFLRGESAVAHLGLAEYALHKIRDIVLPNNVRFTPDDEGATP